MVLSFEPDYKSACVTTAKCIIGQKFFFWPESKSLKDDRLTIRSNSKYASQSIYSPLVNEWMTQISNARWINRLFQFVWEKVLRRGNDKPIEKLSFLEFRSQLNDVIQWTDERNIFCKGKKGNCTLFLSLFRFCSWICRKWRKKNSIGNAIYGTFGTDEYVRIVSFVVVCVCLSVCVYVCMCMCVWMCTDQHFFLEWNWAEEVSQQHIILWYNGMLLIRFY